MRVRRKEAEMRRNMGTTDRLIRGFGIAPVAVGWAALAGWTTEWGIVGLAVAGVMLVTAAVGFCPLYALLRISTARPRRPAHA